MTGPQIRCETKNIKKVRNILLVISKEEREERPLGIRERNEVWRRFGLFTVAAK